MIILMFFVGLILGVGCSILWYENRIRTLYAGTIYKKDINNITCIAIKLESEKILSEDVVMVTVLDGSHLPDNIFIPESTRSTK